MINDKNSSLNREGQRRWLSRLRACGIYVLIAAVLVGILANLRIAEPIERTALSYNILASAEPPEPENKVIIVMCTDRTVQKLAPVSGWPIDRSYYAALLEEAFKDAKTVVFDILFTDETSTKSDSALAEAVNKHGRVVLARSHSAMPISALLDTNSRMGYALEFTENNSDAISRRYKLFVNEDRCTGPSLVCAALLQQGYTVTFDGIDTYTVISPDGETSYLSVDEEGYFYRIPAIHGTDVTVIDLYDVYNGSYSREYFKDAVVFVGGTVAGYEDIVYAPDFYISENGAAPSASMRVIGTKFLADSYLTALRGFSPLRISRLAESIICAVIFLAAAFLAIRIPARFSWAPILGISAVWMIISRLLFVGGICYAPMIMPMLSAVGAYLLVVVISLFMTSREWLVSSVPTEVLYRLTYELEKAGVADTFEGYLQNLSADTFDALGAAVIKAQTDDSDELFTVITPPERSSEGHVSMKAVRGRQINRRFGTRLLMIIPLPIIGDEEPTYTLLGTNRSVSQNWQQSVTALVLAMYIYYKAEKQSAEKQQMAMSMISMIIQMIDAKDPVTAGHSRRVSQISHQLAEWLGYDRKRAADVEFAALLHDIGKIGVEDTVLNKPGVFTAADFAQMKSHPALSAEIVRTVGLSEEIVDGVLHHHERLDGKGYPDGSTGENLTDFAKIIKVADVYDALTSRRQYKAAWSKKRALDTISGGIGTEFDEHIAKVFIENTDPEYSYDPACVQTENVFSEAIITKAVNFARLIWDSAETPVMTKRNTMSRLKEPFSFDCTRKFAGMEWGERFGTSQILKNLPSILHYDDQTDSTLIALRGPRDGNVNNTVCYFRRGCLCAGIATLRPDTADSVTENLCKIYGPSVAADDALIWVDRGLIAIRMNADGNDMIAYLTAYLCNEI